MDLQIETIKFVQANLKKRPVAHDALEQFVKQNNIDICIISEPNIRTSINKNFISDANNHASIWLNDTNTKISKVISHNKEWVGIVTDKEILVISLYLSPNIDDEEVERILEEISEAVSSHAGRALVAGDFNAKSPGWGSRKMDKRGHLVEEWLAEHGLFLLNDGRIPTFAMNDLESYIDLTTCTDSLLKKLKRWRVRDDQESLSDHRFITFEYQDDIPQLLPTPAAKWKFKKELESRLSEEISDLFEDVSAITPEELVERTQMACDRSLTKNTVNFGKKPAYWWSKEINELRKDSIKKRRKMTRKKKTKNRLELENAIEKYKEAKEKYTRAILEAKEDKWKRVCEEIDEDVFGLGYSIVSRKITQHRIPLEKGKTKEILETLFLRTARIEWNPEAVHDPIDLFTLDELVEVAERMRRGKAPGPDYILPEVVKVVVKTVPQVVLKVMNDALEAGIFPAIWKTGRVVLLLKPGKPLLLPASYRPLCLLNTYGKILEGLIVGRINKELGNNGLSSKQFGFRKGFSTVDPITEIYAKADKVRKMPQRKRKFCILAALDVRNAFNSASWFKIIEEMKKKSISPYLVRMIQSYFKDRKIFTDDVELEMYAGVPQGSLAGPLLWNILYDEVLRLKMPDEVTLYAYADDLAILVTSKTEVGIQWRTNKAIETICNWMDEMELKLAPEKTEIIWLTGRKKCRNIDIKVLGEKINMQETTKYLGVYLDRQLTFSTHIDYVLGKASRSVNSLARIMPRQGGPGTAARRVLNQVFESIILYAAPVWVNTLKTKKFRDKLLTIQRKMLLKVSRAYRTTSTDALQVITGVPPIDLRLEQRAMAFRQEKEQKEETKQNMMARWQERWTNGTKGEWTRRLIPNIKEWIENQHGNIDHHMVQTLAGHGCFEEYLYRFKRSNSNTCLYDCGDPDSAEHTVFYCKHWDEIRERTKNLIGETLSIRNFMKTMIKSKEGWNIITDFVRKIMKQKIQDEKRIKAARREENNVT